jgi:hypothetical protein
MQQGLFMPRDGAIIFGDLIGKLLLRVAAVCPIKRRRFGSTAPMQPARGND